VKNQIQVGEANLAFLFTFAAMHLFEVL